jgi:hypothetical protein
MQHTFRVSSEDEQVINSLCSHLEISLADAVRHSLRLAARHYGLIAMKKKPVVEIELETEGAMPPP